MLTASSIRYGGMLVDAAECDYTSFKHLGLLCPICKRSVFLVKEAVRSATQRKKKDGSICEVKGSNVVSYFAHHPEVDKNDVNDCELKSKQITATEKLYLESKARNQRARVMQSHFWKILKTSYELSDPIIADIPDIIRECWLENCVYNERKSLFALQELINLFIKSAKNISEEVRRTEIERVINNIVSADKKNLYKDDLGAEEYVNDWLDSLNLRMQLAISNEAMEFLLHKRQIKMLEHMTYLALDAQIWNECRLASIRKGVDMRDLITVFYPNYIRRLVGSDYDDFMSGTLSGMFTKIVGMLVSVRWAYQFEALENKELVCSR